MDEKELLSLVKARISYEYDIKDFEIKDVVVVDHYINPFSIVLNEGENLIVFRYNSAFFYVIIKPKK